MRFFLFVFYGFVISLWVNVSQASDGLSVSIEPKPQTQKSQQPKKEKDPALWVGDLLSKDLPAFFAGNYTQVKGDVIITNSNLENLKSLQNLTQVSGSLIIGQRADPETEKTIRMLQSFSLMGGVADERTQPKSKPIGGNSKLLSLTGLEKLQRIGSSLHIEDNPKLSSLSALSALNKVKYIEIIQNPQLKSLKGLKTATKNPNNLTSITLANNLRLSNLDALAGAKKFSSLRLIDMPALNSLAAFKNLKIIEGYVTIRGNPQLTSLEGLNGLKRIEDSLYILENESLLDLKALQGLRKLGGKLSIENNRRLKSLAGLEKIKQVKALEIKENTLLGSLEGLNGLTAIKGDVEIISNPLLEDISALNQLKRIDGWLVIYDNSSKPIEGFKSLEYAKRLTISQSIDANAFKKLTQIEKLAVYIKQGGMVESLDGVLPSLKTVKELNISGNSRLIRLGNFAPNLEVAETLYIYNNNALSDFDGINTLLRVKSLTIENNQGINHFNGLNGLLSSDEIRIKGNINLQSINGFKKLMQVKILYIEENLDLLELNGFNSLAQVKSFWIKENPGLKRVGALKTLNSITDTLWIDENPKLIEIGHMASLSKAENLYIDDNPLLPNLQAFSQLKEAKRVRITNNSALTELSGLTHLNKVGYFRIEDNDNIKSLTGMKSLTQVSVLDVDNNDKLVNLKGLENIETFDKLIIQNNSELNDFDGISLGALMSTPTNQFYLHRNKFNPNQKSLALSSILMQKELKKEWLEVLPLRYLSLLRNEVFARKGLRFKDESLTQHFKQYGWYQPQANTAIKLNSTEEDNLKRIKSVEQSRKKRVANAIKTLKSKQATLKFLDAKDDLFKASLKRFIAVIKTKPVLKNQNLKLTESFFISEDPCEDSISIEFNTQAMQLDLTLINCSEAGYYSEDNRFIDTSNESYKACNLRIKDARNDEGVYIGNGCEIETKVEEEGVEYHSYKVLYQFMIDEKGGLKFKQRLGRNDIL